MNMQESRLCFLSNRRQSEPYCVLHGLVVPAGLHSRWMHMHALYNFKQHLNVSLTQEKCRSFSLHAILVYVGEHGVGGSSHPFAGLSNSCT